MPIFSSIAPGPQETNAHDVGIAWYKNTHTAGVSLGYPCARVVNASLTTAGAGTSGNAAAPVDGGNIYQFLGVWKQNVAAGAFGQVCLYGPCLAYVMGSAAATAGFPLVPVAGQNYLTAFTAGDNTAGTPIAGTLGMTYTTASAALKVVYLRLNG